jgi:hypothetical protein
MPNPSALAPRLAAGRCGGLLIFFAMSSGVGCSLPPQLADFPSPSLRLTLSQAERGVGVRIYPREDGRPLASPCKLPAPKARATLNGVVLNRLTGTRAGDDMIRDLDCIVAFGAPDGAIGNMGNAAVLRVEDQSATWTFEVPDAFTPRTMTLVSPDDRIIRRGKEVVVQWSPSSDRMDGKEIDFELYTTEMEPGKGTAIRAGRHLAKAARVRGTPVPRDRERQTGVGPMPNRQLLPEPVVLGQHVHMQRRLHRRRPPSRPDRSHVLLPPPAGQGRLQRLRHMG